MLCCELGVVVVLCSNLLGKTMNSSRGEKLWDSLLGKCNGEVRV